MALTMKWQRGTRAISRGDKYRRAPDRSPPSFDERAFAKALQADERAVQRELALARREYHNRMQAIRFELAALDKGQRALVKRAIWAECIRHARVRVSKMEG